MSGAWNIPGMDGKNARGTKAPSVQAVQHTQNANCAGRHQRRHALDASAAVPTVGVGILGRIRCGRHVQGVNGSRVPAATDKGGVIRAMAVRRGKWRVAASRVQRSIPKHLQHRSARPSCQVNSGAQAR